ncbi:glycine--tRNA ligase subunit beta [Cyanobium sp. CH-040]|uniref:glycine--tRNA ligase subunit beta n=1 Tax=Cyanobium sp. CH-040 TaxID=2823708 RepID=UPI0020CEF0C9|nr:glycine--tRNA ligase subunit beta [Cyanobium sp. CH-040]MCP9926917.1 glycine--tRNA ligase subunit beta [Cyanobium sp. CH-040]
MSSFLLEIGTEELPADFARLALPQLQALVSRDLADRHLQPSALQVTGTPRRLAVLVEGLPAAQPDRHEERKGPPASQAFSAGQPTQAAIGFARRCGVEPAALEVRETPRGPFVFARVVEAGQPAAAVLSELIPGWIQALQGRRFMRWGAGERRFSRPIRWLVALLDAEVLPVELEGCDPPVQASAGSRGHRLTAEPVNIRSAASYRDDLAAAGVEVDRQARADWIRSAVHSAAERHGARADLPAELFDELVDLVEAPLLIEGRIEERYLALPPEVLSTVMRAHQRYVPLVDRQASADPLAQHARGELQPRFLCIANGRPEARETIRRGNERVLRARLADAEFFVSSDRATASIDRRDRLAQVTFAEGLGSLRDRVERMEWCTDVLLEQLRLPAAAAGHARRAAHLCKHDLVSQMVGEFPELQGVMGGKYLLAEGEHPQVALAVLEHYLPRGAGDALPQSDAGAVVALAERLELLLSIYATGERPSGSSDPYALRRAGNGVLQILWDRQWQLDLLAVLDRGAEHWSSLLPHFRIDAAALAQDLAELLRQRLASLLEDADAGVAVDLVQAVAGDSVPVERLLRDPADARQRVDLLLDLRQNGRLDAVRAVVTRAARLAEKADLAGDVLGVDGTVDQSLFEQPSEAAMLTVLRRLEPLARAGRSHSYGHLAEALAASAGTLAEFFDGEQSVMVMADDPAVRRNRLNMLALLRNQASVLADFSCING